MDSLRESAHRISEYIQLLRHVLAESREVWVTIRQVVQELAHITEAVDLLEDPLPPPQVIQSLGFLARHSIPLYQEWTAWTEEVQTQLDIADPQMRDLEVAGGDEN